MIETEGAYATAKPGSRLQTTGKSAPAGGFAPESLTVIKTQRGHSQNQQNVAPRGSAHVPLLFGRIVQPSKMTIHLKSTSSQLRYVKAQNAFYDGEKNISHVGGIDRKKRKKEKKKKKGATRDLFMKSTAAHRRYKLQQKEHHAGQHRRLSRYGGYMHSCTVNETLPSPAAYQNTDLSTLQTHGGKMNLSNTKSCIDQYVCDHRFVRSCTKDRVVAIDSNIYIRFVNVRVHLNILYAVCA
jgi:hypothetical protein